MRAGNVATAATGAGDGRADMGGAAGAGAERGAAGEHECRQCAGDRAGREARCCRRSEAPGETRWFVFGAEPGKTYVVEAVDPYSDLVANTIGLLFAYDASGVAAPPGDECRLHGEPAGAGAGGGERWQALHRADVSAESGQHAEQARDLCGGWGGDAGRASRSGCGRARSTGAGRATATTSTSSWRTRRRIRCVRRSSFCRTRGTATRGRGAGG